jgi:hypothetical protein
MYNIITQWLLKNIGISCSWFLARTPTLPHNVKNAIYFSIKVSNPIIKASVILVLDLGHDIVGFMLALHIRSVKIGDTTTQETCQF